MYILEDVLTCIYIHSTYIFQHTSYYHPLVHTYSVIHYQHISYTTHTFCTYLAIKICQSYIHTWNIFNHMHINMHTWNIFTGIHIFTYRLQECICTCFHTDAYTAAAATPPSLPYPSTQLYIYIDI